MANAARPASEIWVDDSDGDPLDPHGDGTLGPGDPFFDNVLAPMMRGERGCTIVEARDGLFEVKDAHDDA